MSFQSSRFTPPANINYPGVGYLELENSSSMSRTSTRDWRSALRTPPTYRIGNRIRFNYHFALLMAGVGGLLVFFLYVRTGSQSSSDAAWVKSTNSAEWQKNADSTLFYNNTYPLTPYIISAKGTTISYRIAMVADLDVNSQMKKDDGSTVWRSYLKKGHLVYSRASSGKIDIKIRWDTGEPLTLESSFSLKGRGMELSELVTFNGRLLTFDDRTGIVYELVNDKPIPWVILLDGDGHSAKGFKSEWATVQHQNLYVGSMGKEWTTSSGDFENDNPMFVKVINTAGAVRSLDWSGKYKFLRQESQKISWPGYLLHESAVWSELNKLWYFLPRRCSKEKYNETRDEYMGCNILISADEYFKDVRTVQLDASNTSPSHGFSSFKFIPGTEDRIIVAIKSEELNGKTATYITVFDTEGKTLIPEQQIETPYKYEGFEFI